MGNQKEKGADKMKPKKIEKGTYEYRGFIITHTYCGSDRVTGKALWAWKSKNRITTATLSDAIDRIDRESK